MKKKLAELVKAHRQIILYALFGGLTTVIDFSVSFILYGLINHHAANAAAWVAAVIFAFAVNKLWVFESRSWDINVVIREFLGFSGGRVASLVMQEGIFLVAVDIMRFKTAVVKLVSSVLVVVINYLLGKLVFSDKKGTENRD